MPPSPVCLFGRFGRGHVNMLALGRLGMPFGVILSYELARIGIAIDNLPSYLSGHIGLLGLCAPIPWAHGTRDLTNGSNDDLLDLQRACPASRIGVICGLGNFRGRSPWQACGLVHFQRRDVFYHNSRDVP